MAFNDLRESFPSLEDSVTGAGVPLTKSIEGDAASGKVGAVGFAFKDAAGNIILPQLDAQGRLPVTTDTQGTNLRAPGLSIPGVLVGAGTLPTLNTVNALSVTANKTLHDIKARVSCRRSALFQLVYVDASSQVILSEAIVDAGQYTVNLGFDGADAFSVPSSGSSPQLIVRAGNYDKVSDLHASIICTQF